MFHPRSPISNLFASRQIRLPFSEPWLNWSRRPSFLDRVILTDRRSAANVDNPRKRPISVQTFEISRSTPPLRHPRVCAASLRSLLRPRMTKWRGLRPIADVGDWRLQADRLRPSVKEPNPLCRGTSLFSAAASNCSVQGNAMGPFRTGDVGLTLAAGSWLPTPRPLRPSLKSLLLM